MSILRDIPLREYLDSPNVSHSKVRDFAERGPRYYHGRHLAKSIPRDETAALTFGSAFEILLQEGGDAFAEKVLVAPGTLDGRTKEGKAFKAAAGGRHAVSKADYEAMLEMVASIHEHDMAPGLIAESEQQVTLTGELHGLTVQSRPDYVLLESGFGGGAVSIDLKTTKDLNDLHATGIARMFYHTQAALVRRLLALNGHPDASCYLLVVEKCLPYRSALIELPGAMLDAADRWLDEHLTALARCYETNSWPRARPGVVHLETPRWLLPPDQQREENASWAM